MRVIPQYLKVHDEARGSVVAVPRRWQQVRKDWWNYLKQSCVIYDEQDEPPLKLQVINGSEGGAFLTCLT